MSEASNDRGGRGALGEAFSQYLVAGDRGGLEDSLTNGLIAAGHDLDAQLWQAWCESGGAVTIATGPWARRRAHVGVMPPRSAKVGELWFDVCSLSPMVQVERSWLCARPTARWQLRGFLDAADIQPREVQVRPPYRALDRERLLGGGAGDHGPAANLTAGEATLYAWWFGMSLPHLFDWQNAVEHLGAAADALWGPAAREWTSTRLADDEAARVFVTRQTIDLVPSEVADKDADRPESDRIMIRGELTRDPTIGFRTAVTMQTGLFRSASASHAIPEDVKLGSSLDRSAFR
jgi:hypothetical protein